MLKVFAWLLALITLSITLLLECVICVRPSAQNVETSLQIALNATMTLHSILSPIQLLLQQDKMAVVWKDALLVSSKIRPAYASNAMKVVQCVMRSIFVRIVRWIGWVCRKNCIISWIFNVRLTVVSAFTLINRTLIITSAEVARVIA
jgi:hypothetical protein